MTIDHPNNLPTTIHPLSKIGQLHMYTVKNNPYFILVVSILKYRELVLPILIKILFVVLHFLQQFN